MKTSILLTMATFAFALVASAEEPKETGFTDLFNGKDVEGWKNPYSHGEISVVDGEIHLLADKKFFFVYDQKFSDFVLEVDIHLPEGPANSGVMFRAHVEDEKVYGYQAECDGSDRCWSGGLYDEGRRKWVWPSKKGKSKDEFLAHSEESLAHMAKPEVKGALKRNDWNTYRITANGDHLTIEVNGVLITDLKDSTDAEGYIAIQHHGEDGQVYRFRNIRIKELNLPSE